MEGKVTLIDADGNTIGETFTRRARQLVKQQRANWTNDSHTAVQFLPDIPDALDSLASLSLEEWETAAPVVARESASDSSMGHSEKDTVLYAMAEKRIRERRWFWIHTIVFLPGFLAIVIFSHAFIPGLLGRRHVDSSVLFLFGAWVTFFACHFYSFFKNHVKPPLAITQHLTTRRAVRIAAEMETLKRMGYNM